MQIEKLANGRTKQLATMVHPDLEMEVRLRAAQQRKSVSTWIHDVLKKELDCLAIKSGQIQ